MRVEARREFGWGASWIVTRMHSQLRMRISFVGTADTTAERADALKCRAREASRIPVEDMLLDYLVVPSAPRAAWSRLPTVRSPRASA